MSWEAFGSNPIYDEPEPEPCKYCNEGKVKVKRNAKGEIDWLEGKETEELTDCEECKGTGEIEPREHDYDYDWS